MGDVNFYYNNIDSARSAIKRLMKEGMVAKIRNNMYTCVSGETGAPVANRFQIASYITPVPGGVGPMTIAMLMNNVIKATKEQNNMDSNF